jgi:hypothetical protein
MVLLLGSNERQIKVMEKVNYDNVEHIWREIPGYDGRYMMSTDDRVVDLQPEVMDYNSMWLYEKERKRDLVIKHNAVYLTKDGKRFAFRFYNLKREVFPELYYISDEKINEIKERIEKNKIAVTYDLDTFNRLIYPNRLLYILDVTQTEGRKWRIPTKVEIDDANHTFVLYKGHKYLGVGLKYIILFDDLFPKNGRPYEEDPYKENKRCGMKKKRGSTKEYNMGLL